MKSTAYVFFRKMRGEKGLVYSSKSVGRFNLGVFQISIGNSKIKSFWVENLHVWFNVLDILLQAMVQDLALWSSSFKGALERLISHHANTVVVCYNKVFEDLLASPLLRGMLGWSLDPGTHCGVTVLCTTGESGRSWGWQGNSCAWKNCLEVQGKK